MGRAALVLTLGNVALALALAATLALDARWPRGAHDVAYVALATATLLAWPLLRRRRVTSLLLASLGAWSLATGVFLAYATPYFGHAGWMRWWHSVTSMGFALAFLAHWARNNPRLVGLARRLGERRAEAGALALAWAALLAFGALTWWTDVGRFFTDVRFRDLTLVALGAAALAAEGFLVSARFGRLRARFEDDAARNRARGAVDASLLASTWLATLTGLALLYLARPLRAADAYWLAAWWHVATSAVLGALVAAHLAFNARFLAAHARRIGGALARGRS